MSTPQMAALKMLPAACNVGARVVGITTTQKVSTLSDANIIIDRLSPSLVDRLFPEVR